TPVYPGTLSRLAGPAALVGQADALGQQVAEDRAVHVAPHDAGTVDEERRGEPSDVVLPGDVPRAVEPDGVREPVGVDELPNDGRPLAEVDREDHEVVVREALVVHLLELRHLDPTGGAPGRPEVEHNRL